MVLLNQIRSVHDQKIILAVTQMLLLLKRPGDFHSWIVNVVFWVSSDKIILDQSTVLHRCWWRMLETKYVGDNFEMLVTEMLADFVTNILYLLALASGTNIQKMSPISKFCNQHPKIFTNIKSQTSNCHQHLCSQNFHISETGNSKLTCSGTFLASNMHKVDLGKTKRHCTVAVKNS